MKKIYKILIFGTPTIIIGTAGGTMYYLKKNKELNKNWKKENFKVQEKIFSSIDIFPKLNAKDYYKYIRIKNGISYISDKFISYVVQDIINKTKISNSNIKWDYAFVSENRKEIEIIFEANIYYDEISKKSYIFKISEN